MANNQAKRLKPELTSTSATQQSNQEEQKKPSKGSTIFIFHATGKKNEKGELNWFEIREVEEVSLSLLNELVGGYIDVIRSPKKGVSFVMVVNDEGEIKYAEHEKGIGLNDLAGGAGYELGFGSDQPSFFCVSFCSWKGTVVCVGLDKDGDFCGLKKDEVTKLELAVKKYCDRRNCDE